MLLTDGGGTKVHLGSNNGATGPLLDFDLQNP
jgi:hypothetical protein